MEWISTKTRLPQVGWTVWAYWTPVHGKAVRASCFGSVTLGGPDYWHNPEDDEDDYAMPTYWMPITPPEGLKWESAEES